MILFDYAFYRICKAYSNTKQSSPEFTAAIVLAVMQAFNIMTVLMLIELKLHNKSILSKPLVVSMFLLFLVINYIRYVYRETNDYKTMSEKYNAETSGEIKGGLVLFYILFSVGLCLAFAIYCGSQSYH